MKTMYEVPSYGIDIYKINVVSETEKTYTIEKDWCGKSSTSRFMKNGHNIFVTWDEAKEFVIRRAEKTLESRKRQVVIETANLESAKSMTP